MTDSLFQKAEAISSFLEKKVYADPPNGEIRVEGNTACACETAQDNSVPTVLATYDTQTLVLYRQFPASLQIATQLGLPPTDPLHKCRSHVQLPITIRIAERKLENVDIQALTDIALQSANNPDRAADTASALAWIHWQGGRLNPLEARLLLSQCEHLLIKHPFDTAAAIVAQVGPYIALRNDTFDRNLMDSITRSDGINEGECLATLSLAGLESARESALAMFHDREQRRIEAIPIAIRCIQAFLGTKSFDKQELTVDTKGDTASVLSYRGIRIATLQEGHILTMQPQEQIPLYDIYHEIEKALPKLHERSIRLSPFGYQLIRPSSSYTDDPENGVWHPYPLVADIEKGEILSKIHHQPYASRVTATDDPHEITEILAFMDRAGMPMPRQMMARAVRFLIALFGNFRDPDRPLALARQLRKLRDRIDPETWQILADSCSRTITNTKSPARAKTMATLVAELGLSESISTEARARIQTIHPNT